MSHIITFISGTLLIPIAKFLLKKSTDDAKDGESDGADNAIYNLDHGRLNIELPPKTMWMNMGYWEVRLFAHSKIVL